jgi:hypothetical protein
MLRPDGRSEWGWCVAAAIGAGAAATLRAFAPALVVGLAAALWLRPDGRRRWRRNLAATAVLALPLAVFDVAWALRCSSVQASSTATYFEAFVARRGAAGVAAHVVQAVPPLVSSVSDAVLGTDLGLVVGALLGALIGVGFVASARRREVMVCVVGALHVGGVLLGSPGGRYLLPALPMLVYWLVLGVERTGSWLTERLKWLGDDRVALATRALFALVLAVNVGRIGKIVWQARSTDFYGATEPRMTDYFAASDRLRRDPPGPDRPVMAREYRALHYFSRVRTVRTPKPRQARDAAELALYIKKNRVGHIVRDPGKDKIGPMLDELIESHAAAFEQVGRVGALALLRVHPDRLGEDGP